MDVHFLCLTPLKSLFDSAVQKLWCASKLYLAQRSAKLGCSKCLKRFSERVGCMNYCGYDRSQYNACM